MKGKKISLFRLFIATSCLILAILNYFFFGSKLTLLIFSLATILLILNGLEVLKNKTQPRGMGYFYLGVGFFLIMVIVITSF